MTRSPLGPSLRSDVTPFLAMDVLRAATELEATGRNIVHMEVGQPGAPAPGPVLAAARKALESGRLGYTESLGIRPLRERLARHYQDKYGRDVTADRVMVTTGSSGGFLLTFLGAFDAGARIAMTSPGYPAYRNILASLGLEAVEIPVGPETRWSLTPELLERAHREKPLDGVLVASPANPTGTMIAPDLLERLCAFCSENDLRFISDEIYHGLVYSGREETALAFNDDAIIVNSFSKYYCMTGWRVGWLILPENLVRPFERLAQSLFISVPELSQRAAVAAFDSTAELDLVKAGYAANRDFLLKRLPEIGFNDVLPVDGAFYAYASVRNFSNDSLDFSRRMLNEAGVAATPGADFDRERGHMYIRFSFAGTAEAMSEGVDRIAEWLK